MNRCGACTLLGMAVCAATVFATEAMTPRDDSKILEPGSLIVKGSGGRMTVADWNGDGKKDIIVCGAAGECTSRIAVLLNTGTDAAPAFGVPQPLLADGHPISTGKS